MDLNNKVIYSTFIAFVIAAGIGIGFTVQHADMATTAPSTSNSGVYHLTLVITTNNYYNNTTDQPAFYVLHNGSLQSSANIVLPANSLIEVTIINYDSGNASIPAADAKVSGTVGNQITVINNTLINSTATQNGISVKGAWITSSVQPSDIAHTFTIASLNLNIPIVVSSIEQFSFHTANSNTYTWQCYATCGSGSSGWGGAMSTPGWMTGTVTVQ